MTKLEELINELCPDGVEYVPIKEITKFEQPTKYIVKSTNYRDDFNTPVLTAGQTFILGYTNETDGIYNASKEHPVIIFDDFTGAFKWVDFPFKVKSSAMKMISANKDVTTLRYIYHVMGHLNFISSEHKRLWIGIYSAFRVPLPPLSIQSEIVHILDSFTLLTADLTAELTAELTARQKQYAFYRDYLLDFSNEDVIKKIPDIDCSNVEYLTLNDVCEFVRGPFGGSLKKEIFINEGYAVYEQQNAIYNRFKFRYFISKNDFQRLKRFEVKTNDLIMSCSGTMGKIAIIPDNAPKGIINQALLKLTPKSNIDSHYLKYYFENTISKIMNDSARGGAIKNVASVSELKKISIPVPPLSVQENIVKILDRFDKLNNDMSEGLPAEIEARKKQYEYYRDTLLSFDDKACSHIVKVEREGERELTRTKAIKWLKLSDVVTIERGKRVVRNDLSQEIGYPVYQNALKPLGYYTDKNRNANSVFVIGAGAAGEIGYSYVDYWAADDCFTFVCDDKLNQRYLYFLLMSKQAYLKNNVRKSSIPRLPRIALENMEIPVPPLEEQEHIVSILDRFDKLCNDISEGLPAEIEARQKQYEYYRDKLLTFKMRN